MKTKIPYMIALLLIVVLASWQRGPATGSFQLRADRSIMSTDRLAQNTKALVHYQVNVFLSSSITPCGTYMVAVTNGSGGNVAPPQIWSPTKEKYFFTELTNAGPGIRIAKLVRLQPNRSGESCPTVMVATPDSKTLGMVDGRVFFFDLLANESNNY